MWLDMKHFSRDNTSNPHVRPCGSVTLFPKLSPVLSELEILFKKLQKWLFYGVLLYVKTSNFKPETEI
jgi:hypothetical protein